jgi:hypothetical protein
MIGGQTMVRASSEPFLQLRLRQHALSARVTRLQRVLIGLLIAATLGGSIAALQFSVVTGPHPQKNKPAFLKIQDRLIPAAEPATARSVSHQTSEQSDSQSRISAAEVEAFSVANIRPTNGFITHVSSTQPDSASTPTPSSQSTIAAEPRAVPLPRRKPSRAALPRAKRQIAKEAQTTTSTQKPLDQPQNEQPKPMAFGSIGYNYDPQR